MITVYLTIGGTWRAGVCDPRAGYTRGNGGGSGVRIGTSRTAGYSTSPIACTAEKQNFVLNSNWNYLVYKFEIWKE